MEEQGEFTKINDRRGAGFLFLVILLLCQEEHSELKIETPLFANRFANRPYFLIWFVPRTTPS